MNQEISSKIIKSARVISFMTLLSRIFGYFRDRCMSVYLGTGTEADAFTIAFLIPNVLRRLFGEGSMTAAFLPTFSDFIHKKRPKKQLGVRQNFFLEPDGSAHYRGDSGNNIFSFYCKNYCTRF